MFYHVCSSTREGSTYFSAAIVLFFQASPSLASPPAGDRSIVDKFLFADSAVKAKVIQSRRWQDSLSTGEGEETPQLILF
jgi:hypothetical protein